MHRHSPAVIPFGVVATPLQPSFTWARFWGSGFRCSKSATPAGRRRHADPDSGLGEALAKSLGNAAVGLLRGHGNVVVGGSVKEAVFRAVYTEINARLQAEASRIGQGQVAFLNEAEAMASMATNQGHIIRPGNYGRRSNSLPRQLSADFLSIRRYAGSFGRRATPAWFRRFGGHTVRREWTTYKCLIASRQRRTPACMRFSRRLGHPGPDDPPGAGRGPARPSAVRGRAPGHRGHDAHGCGRGSNCRDPARELAQVVVGAGTLLRAADVATAIQAGAGFLVDPPHSVSRPRRWRPNRLSARRRDPARS